MLKLRCRQNQIEGQLNLRDAIRRNIAFTDPKSGKQYALKSKIATLMVRPRGLHLPEKHLRVDDRCGFEEAILPLPCNRMERRCPKTLGQLPGCGGLCRIGASMRASMALSCAAAQLFSSSLAVSM